MKRSLGAALPLILLMALSPLSAIAQQTQPDPLAADTPTIKSGITLDDPLNPVWGPKDMMSMSGMFLGIVGMMGGAAMGSALGQGQCEDAEKGCMGRHAFTGALVAGTFFVPLAVHLANQQPRNFVKSIAVSMIAGAAFYYSMKAIPGQPVQIAPFLAAPVQMLTSIKIETWD
jgi:hypothetical protein